MIIVVLVLIFLSFLQAVLWPVSLVLLVLISRSFLSDDRKNFWLAFVFGLLLSLLLGLPLGSLSLIYLLIITAVAVFKKTQPTSPWLMVLPIAFILLGLERLIQGWWSGSSLEIWPLIIEVVLVLPVYLVVSFWEERFTAKGDLKLKLGK